MTNLKFEAAYEREVTSTEEAEALKQQIYNALDDYAAYLDRHGLIYDMNLSDPLKVQGLIADIDFRGCWSCGIRIKGGAIDCIYADQPIDEEGQPKPSH